MKLTEEQAVRLARVAAQALGLGPAKHLDRQVEERTEAERTQAVVFAEAVLRDVIRQGIVIQAPPIKPFVDLRSI